MRKRISDLLDACQDDSVELSGNTPLSSARIKEMTMNKITPKKKHLYRLPARLLAAAAIAAALTASAFAAVYIAGAGELMQDFFTKDGAPLSTGQIENLDQVGQTFEGGRHRQRGHHHPHRRPGGRKLLLPAPAHRGPGGHGPARPGPGHGRLLPIARE